MNDSPRLWGLHNDVRGQELIDGGYVAIGWGAVGDLHAIGDNQLRMRVAVADKFPEMKRGAVPGTAGTLRRFTFEAQIGDLLVFPNKQDRTLAFGRITGGYEFDAQDGRQPHHRQVEWLKTGVARTLFSQSAPAEIGSAITMFGVHRHRQEFLFFITAGSEEEFASTRQPQAVAADDEVRADIPDSEALMPTADDIDQHTRDFVADVLKNDLSHEEFEQFTADLLRCMGYESRVTRYVGDGGVDVIAHRDLLGVEPPIIKVQCKHTAETQGRPAVQQLIGTLDKDEAGLFFTLGSYSSEALSVERERQNLRLFSGTEVTDLTLRYYGDLPPRWRSRMPLRRMLVVDAE